jgi:malate dehydrogenase
MGIHIAVVGNGRIGRPTAYSILSAGLMDELSLVDIKPGQSWAYGEELKHAAASLKNDVKIYYYEKDEEVSNADLIVVCPGKPRIPGVAMDRRDLAVMNAATINYVAQVMPNNNPSAKWVIISNPVDAMATLFKKTSKANFVISTGDCPDTLRYRTKLSIDLNVPVSHIEGFIGGEHGSAAYPLWSTTNIEGKKIEDYLKDTNKKLNKQEVVEYVRGVSKKLVDIIGATEFGPAAGFRDIVRAIIQDKREMISIANSIKFTELPEAVNISIPTLVGEKIGPNIWDKLLKEEQENIKFAAKAIYENYTLAAGSLKENQ